MAGNRARYKEALSKAHSYIWDQRWEEAIREFEVALEEFGKEPVPYAGLGDAYQGLDEPEEALANYKQAARYSKGDVIYLRKVAELQEQLDQTAGAGQTYMAIGEIQLRRGAVDEAVTNWHRATRLAPNLLSAQQRLAKYYTQQGQVRAAIRAYLAVARLYQARGEGERAVQTCRAALNLDPRNPDVLTAIEMIQHGEKIFAEEEAEPVQSLGDELSETVKRMTAGYEQERPEVDEKAGPVENARQMAMEQLAEQLFEEDAEEWAQTGDGALSKAERATLISQGLDFQRRGMSHEAISRYERAIAGGVDGAAAHFNLGLLYQDKLRFDDAIREFKLAIREEDYRLASHYALGESYRARGEIDKAVEHFVTVLKIVDLATVRDEQANQLSELYESLAASLLTGSEPERATEFANALVEFLGQKGWEDRVKDARDRLNALSGDRMMILGDILTAGSAKVLEALYLSQEYSGRGMLNTAIEEVYRAIALSPHYLPTHIQLGELLVQQERMEAAVNKFVTVGDAFRVRGDMANAITLYERIVEVSPLDLSIRARLVDLLKSRGQIDRSLEHYLSMGEAYYQLAQPDKAREAYQQALKLAPQGSDEENWRAKFLRRIADIDMQRFDWKPALAAYRELRRNDPADEQAAMTLIDLYYKVGQPAYALRELDHYLKHLVASGRGSKVLGILEDMVQRHPTDPGLVQRLVRLYLSQGERQKALERLDALGEAQLDEGDVQRAIVTIEQIVQLKPENVASYQQLLKQLRQS